MTEQNDGGRVRERGMWRDSRVGFYMTSRGHFTNFGLDCEPDDSPCSISTFTGRRTKDSHG